MMNYTLSKKQTSVANKDRLRQLREAKKSRAQAREGHAHGYKPTPYTPTGYIKKTRELEWKGHTDASNDVVPFRGEGVGQSRSGFYLHPITNTAQWDTHADFLCPVTQYYYESTAPHATLPHCVL